MTWIDALVRAGARVWVTAEHVALTTPDGATCGPVPLVRWRRYLRPVDLGRVPEGAMLVADQATGAACRALTEQGTWWALTDGRYSVAGLERLSSVDPDPVACRRPPPTDAELAALLVGAPDRTHRFYAEALGVSRVRVTQLVGELHRLWVPLDKKELLRHWVAADVRVAGHVSRWTSTTTVWEQAKGAYEWLEKQRAHPVLGGAVAADAIRPWAAPASAVIHVRKITPPPPGHVVADSHRSGTITVVVDERPTVPSLATDLDTPLGRMRIAHPLHVLADMRDDAVADDRVREHWQRLFAALDEIAA